MVTATAAASLFYIRKSKSIEGEDAETVESREEESRAPLSGGQQRSDRSAHRQVDDIERPLSRHASKFDRRDGRHEQAGNHDVDLSDVQ